MSRAIATFSRTVTVRWATQEGATASKVECPHDRGNDPRGSRPSGPQNAGQQSRAPVPRISDPDSRFQIRDFKFEMRDSNREFEIQIRDEIQDPEFEISNLRSQIRD